MEVDQYSALQPATVAFGPQVAPLTIQITRVEHHYTRRFLRVFRGPANLAYSDDPSGRQLTTVTKTWWSTSWTKWALFQIGNALEH